MKERLPSTYQAATSLQIRQRNFPWARVTLHGMSYFESPDHLTIQFENVPGYMRSLPEAYAKMLNVAAWPVRYDVALGEPLVVNGHTDITLNLTPKTPPIDERGVALINPMDWTVEQVRWSLSGGVNISMSEAYKQIGFYRLPAMQMLTVRTPYATADGIGSFSNYVVNAPIDQKIFSQP